MKLTQEYLKEILEYNPETGVWIWLISSGCKKRDQQAGNINQKGYRRIYINGRFYMAHQLAWFYMIGKWPKEELDHKNNTPDDNRWNNLREATNHQNKYNRKNNVNNTSGIKGVHWHKNILMWNARIGVNGKKIHLGYFTIKEDAARAYNEAAIKYYGEFARLNEIQDKITKLPGVLDKDDPYNSMKDVYNEIVGK
jgi:hypothetical protein